MAVRPNRFAGLFPTAKPIIGVIHLPSLPGFEGSPGLQRAVAKALADLATLEAGGMDAALVENEHDHPHEVEASRHTIASMTRVAGELVAAGRRPVVGVEILLNDPRAAIAVAAASGARFIRSDYFVDRMARPDHGGEMTVDPVGLLAYRRLLGADHVLIFADIQVKYGTMLEPRSLSESAAAAAAHGADAIVVTGAATGDPPTVAQLDDARRGAGTCPVLVGSGLTPVNASALLGACDGAIVGTSVKIGESIDRAAVRSLMQAVYAARHGDSAQRPGAQTARDAHADRLRR